MCSHKTASYRIIPEKDGIRYKFFCDASGMALCTTAPVYAKTQDESLMLAWKREGRKYFNLCSKCGRWVSDVMYNAETGQCVSCSVWEDIPAFCPNCGVKLTMYSEFCFECGHKLQYKEVV
ncbi:MAG: zinc-ribbon domain-containing protein [Lachnospiraceae bacterium]|nr:zinc-ribbon domain-containing protein [Lachnospiraceae bacterium]